MSDLAINTIIDKNQELENLDLDETVRLEVKASVLSRLLEKKQVCAADFNCLDCPSKKCVMALCLKTCLSYSDSCI